MLFHRSIKEYHSCAYIEAVKEYQTRYSELEILSVIHPEKFKGKKVVLVDEFYNYGKTLNDVKMKISKCGEVPLDNIFTCTVFIKNKRIQQYPLPNLYGMEVPDVWLIGHVLDDKPSIIL